MIVLGLDLESTGRDVEKDRITEIAYVLWETDNNYPLLTSCSYLHDTTYPKLSAEVSLLNGITQDNLVWYGSSPGSTLISLNEFLTQHQPHYIVAHNSENFDKPLLLNEFKRNEVDSFYLNDIPWIDTCWDIPYKYEPDSRKLKYVACDHGVVNPFSHRALFDVMTMLSVMSKYSFNEILEYKKTPWVIVQAVVDYDNREKAKDKKYLWQQIGNKTFDKKWVKKIKLDKLEFEKSKCDFEVKVLE